MSTQDGSKLTGEQELLKLADPTRLLVNPAERDEVDFKATFSKEKEDLGNTIKIYAAMANIGGGLIVYGVQGTELKGLSQEQVDLLDPARLGDYLKKYLSPVPRLKRAVVEYENKKFALITVEPTFTSPVLITQLLQDKDGKTILRPGALYIRENTKSIEAHTESQARKALDQIIGFQVRARLSELVPILSGPGSRNFDQPPTIEVVGRKQAQERSAIDPSTPVREMILTPKGENAEYGIPVLRPAFEQRFKLGGLTVPHYAVDSPEFFSGVSEGGIISGFADRPDGRRVFARIGKDGSLYWCSTLIEDNLLGANAKLAERFKEGVGVMFTLNLLTLAIRFAHALVDALQLTEGMDLTYGLRNIKDRTLMVEDFSRLDFYSAKRCFDQVAQVKGHVEFKAPLAGQMALTEELVIDLYQQFNWSDPTTSQVKKDVTAAFTTSQLDRVHLQF